MVKPKVYYKEIWEELDDPYLSTLPTVLTTSSKQVLESEP